MSRPFDRVVVIGVGLIGGSLAAGIRSLADAPQVRGIDADARTLAVALERGAIDEAITAMEIDSALLHADLVVIATPASAAASIAHASACAPPGCVRTTTMFPVGSTISRTCGAVLRRAESSALRSLAGSMYLARPPASLSLVRPSSPRSRDTVVWLTSKPSSRSASTRSPWL